MQCARSTADGASSTCRVVDWSEMIEKQPIIAPAKNRGGQKQDDTVTVGNTLKTVRKPTTEKPCSAIKDALKQSSENCTADDHSKQTDGATTVPVELKISQKHSAEKQPPPLKDPPPEKPIRNQPVDEIKTNTDGAVMTNIDSKTKQKSIKKKKSTVAEEKPTCSVAKLNVSKELDTVRIASKKSNRKKKDSVKDNSPAVSVGAELYVGRLSKLIETDQLNETFGKFGKLISVNIFEASGKNKSETERRNYGIIQYENSNTVDVVTSFGTVMLGNGDKVIVEKSKKKSKPQAKTD
jgi:hypothetical protein